MCSYKKLSISGGEPEEKDWYMLHFTPCSFYENRYPKIVHLHFFIDLLLSFLSLSYLFFALIFSPPASQLSFCQPSVGNSCLKDLGWVPWNFPCSDIINLIQFDKLVRYLNHKPLELLNKLTVHRWCQLSLVNPAETASIVSCLMDLGWVPWSFPCSDIIIWYVWQNSNIFIWYVFDKIVEYLNYKSLEVLTKLTVHRWVFVNPADAASNVSCLINLDGVLEAFPAVTLSIWYSLTK